MKDWLGYLGAPVALAGILLEEPDHVRAGLAFLLLWQALSVRGRLGLRRVRR